MIFVDKNGPHTGTNGMRYVRTTLGYIRYDNIRYRYTASNNQSNGAEGGTRVHIREDANTVDMENNLEHSYEVTDTVREDF